MSVDVTFDERHALDIVDDLIKRYNANPTLEQDPTKLILIPDRLTGNQLVSYLTRKRPSRSMILNDLVIITFEQFAYWILGENHKILDPELRKLIATSCVLNMNDRISQSIQDCLEGVENKERSPIIENLLGELEEYSSLKSPSFRPVQNIDSFFKKRITQLNPVLKQRAEDVLEFFDELEQQCIQQMQSVGIDQQTHLTRSHLIGAACQKLSRTNLADYPRVQSVDEIFILGVAVFDTTLLDFLAQILLKVKSATISASKTINTQLVQRLKCILGNKFPSKPKMVTRKASSRKALTTVKLPDRRREIEFAALKCIELLKEKEDDGETCKYTPSDILLVSRLASDYAPYFKNVFNDYGLPAFMQVRVSMIFTPIYRLVESVLDLLVKYKKNDKVRARDIAKSLRLGFPYKATSRTGDTYYKPTDDRRFLIIESVLESREIYDGAGTVDRWIQNLEKIVSKQERDPEKHPWYAYDPPIQLLKWIKDIGENPSINHLTTLVERFIRFYGTQEEYPVLGFIPQSRFNLTKEHISSEASRILNDLYALMGHSAKVAKARSILQSTNKTSDSWGDIRTAFMGVIGSDTYGRVYRDSDSILFVDAGISHFIDAKYRIVLGLTNDQFPRKLKEPFLLFMELRDVLNNPSTGSFLTNGENHREIERYLFDTAKGRKKNKIITMNYLDDRGHRQHWSVFIPDGKDDPDVWPHELRVELSGFQRSNKTNETHCVSTALFDYLRQTRQEQVPDYDKGLMDLGNNYHQSNELDQESEAVTTSTKAMKERVIDGLFNPMLNIDGDPTPSLVFCSKKQPMSWELDLVEYCPSMYYFYVFYYLLPHMKWTSESSGHYCHFRYKPAYKTDFRLHRIPPPVWRTQFSSVGTNWIQSKMGGEKGSAPLIDISKAKVDKLTPEIDELKISPAEKRALRELLEHLLKLDYKFEFRHEQYSDSLKFIRPFVVYKNQNNQTCVYKLSARNPFDKTVLCGNQYKSHRLGSSVSKYGMISKSIDSLIEAVTSLKSFEQKVTQREQDGRVSLSEKVCKDCPYRTLCGEWGF